MCLENERKPTLEERKTIVEGWKVFNDKEYGLFSLYNHKIYIPTIIFNNGWNEAEHLKDLPDEAGFYVFLNEYDALSFLNKVKRIGIGNKIKKVKIRGIIGIGEGMQHSDCEGLKPIIRCRSIYIPVKD